MKYIFCPLVISVLFFSFCNKAKNEDLKMEILNTEIISRGNINDKHVRNVSRFDNYIYDSLPVNKINLKITNIGTKKYVFFIKKELDKVESSQPENMKLNVFNDKGLIQPTYLGYMSNLTNEAFEIRKWKNEKNNDSLKQELNEKYLKEKIDESKIRFQQDMNYVVIHSGETKFFSYYRTMPVFWEYEPAYYMYEFEASSDYYFQLSFKNDAKTLKKYITINQLKEIEANGYTLFDGEIKSNKVPIKFINMGKDKN